MIDELPQFPEQVNTVFLILQYLQEKAALSDDPLTVEMTREDYPSVYPCRRPKIESKQLDLTQLIEARKKIGTWWFIGPIKELVISKLKKDKLDKADLRLLDRLANQAEFKLVFGQN